MRNTGVAVFGVAEVWRPAAVASGEPACGNVGDALEDAETVGVVETVWEIAVGTDDPTRVAVRVAVGDSGRSVEVAVAVGVGLLVGVTVGAQARAGKSTTESFTRALQSASRVRAATAILVSEPSRLAPVRMKVWVRSG